MIDTLCPDLIKLLFGTYLETVDTIVACAVSKKLYTYKFIYSDILADAKAGWRYCISFGRLKSCQLIYRKMGCINDMGAQYELAFTYGQLEIIKWMLMVNPTYRWYDANAFLMSCCFDQTKVVEWFLQRYRLECRRNIDYSYIFRTICTYGRLEIIKLLVTYLDHYDYQINTNEFFYELCIRGHLSMASWFVEWQHYVPGEELLYNILIRCCQNKNNLDILKWLYYDIANKNGMTISTATINDMFLWICAGSTSLYYNQKQQTVIAQWLYEICPQVDLHGANEENFRSICILGNMDLFEWIIQHGHPINIYTKHCEAFRISCGCGHLAIAKRIVEIGELSDHPIDIHAVNEYPFRISCRNGHLDIARWLYQLGLENNSPINIHAKNDYALKETVRKRPQVATWLCNLEK